jgi:Ca-activated chloride channel family protein
MHRIFFVIRAASLWLRSTWRTCVGGMPKSLRFAVVGALGCLGGAVAGEGLLTTTRSAAATNTALGPRSICLVIDSSGSMKGSKLAEVQSAARNFVTRQDLTRNRIGAVQFASDAKLAVPITSDRGQVESAIVQMHADGSTAMNLGLEVTEEALSTASSPRHILLFTDGKATWPSVALSAARRIRHRGIQIVAIGTGDADHAFLTQVTGSPGLVLWATSGQFEDAFRAAERLIASASLLDASSGYDLVQGLARTGGWTALLALGLGSSLIGAQNRYLRKPLFSRRDALVGASRCLAAGLLAGAIGQSLFAFTCSDVAASACGPVLLGAVLGALSGQFAGLSVKRRWLTLGIGAGAGAIIAIGTRLLWSTLSSWYWIPTILALPLWGGISALLLWTASQLGTGYLDARSLRAAAVAGVAGRILFFFVEAYIGEVAMLLTDATTRLIGWSILGSLLGLGLSLFIPNLIRRHALWAGGASGIAGAVLYLTVTVYLGGFSARVIRALALGFAMGLMIVVAEVACREQWLEIAYSPNDRRTINLGAQAVTVAGNMPSRQSNDRSTPATALTYRIEKNAVVCQDATTGRICRVVLGQTRIIDGAQVTVRSRNA